MKLYTLIFLFLVVFISCNGLKSEHVVNGYYLVSDDGNGTNSLSYSIDDDNTSFVDIISEKVLEVNFNDKYIVVKQLSKVSDSINYFIIPIHKEFTYDPKAGIGGPFSKEKFKNKIDELGISELKI